MVSACANAGPAAQYTRLIHRSAWSCSAIVSSPKRSESASTTTRPSPYSVTTASGACGLVADGEACAITFAPLDSASVPAR